MRWALKSDQNLNIQYTLLEMSIKTAMHGVGNPARHAESIPYLATKRLSLEEGASMEQC